MSRSALSGLGYSGVPKIFSPIPSPIPSKNKKVILLCWLCFVSVFVVDIGIVKKQKFTLWVFERTSAVMVGVFCCVGVIRIVYFVDCLKLGTLANLKGLAGT